MAWCSYCGQNRPIRRQDFGKYCIFCGVERDKEHLDGCRGTAPNQHDVCAYCNSELFARARNTQDYDQCVHEEGVRVHGNPDRDAKSSGNTGGDGCMLLLAFVGLIQLAYFISTS
jgi:hypothetical protein